MKTQNQINPSNCTLSLGFVFEGLLLAGLAVFCLCGGAHEARDSMTWEEGFASSTSHPATLVAVGENQPLR